MFPGHEGATDRRALLTRLHRHLLHDLLDEEVELLGAGSGVRSEHREVERVGFLVEPNVVLENGLAAPQRQTGRRRAGERDRVLAREVIEQIAGASAHQLKRAGRKDAGLHHRARHHFGEVAGHRRRLHDARHTSERGGGELLQHPPHRKVERVDLNGDSLHRHADVPPDEGATFAQRLRTTVHVVGLVRKLPPTAARVGEQGSDASVDVDPRVAARGTREGGDTIELLLSRREILRERLQHARTLVEGHPAQRRATDRATVVEHRGEVEPLARGDRYFVTGDRVEERSTLPRAGDPLAERVVLQSRHDAVSFQVR